MTSETLSAKQVLWRERLLAWQQSGLSTAQWYRQQRLPEHQFFYWKRKLKLGTENKLIPVMVSPEEVPASNRVTIHLPSGLRVETETTDVVALVRQLEVS